jgi:cell division protein ZapA (FtsZ GTPase activity inhibitor)
MRTDLRLVYSELEKVSERISSYYTAIEEVEIAVSDMRSFLEEQESEAITKLKEKLDSVTIDMADKKSMLEALGNILDDYIADMRGLVREAVSGNQTRVDTLDISYNLWQMKNAYQSLEQATAFPVSSESFWQFGDEEEAEEERRKRERNYQKLENFRSNQLAGLKTRMKSRLDGIDDIYKKYLKAFETMDDSYRKRLDEIYNEKTSSQDKRKNFWESFGNISKTFLKAFAVAAAGAVLLALLPAWAPLVMLGGVALTGIGCMVMAEVPKEYVPEWMSGIKDTSDGVSKKLKGYLKRPEGMIEDIGQGLMDTVQTPKGIASVSGTVSGMLLGNWAGKMIKPQVYTQVGKTKENVVKWWKSASNNVRTAGNGGRAFQVKSAPRVKRSVFLNKGISGADDVNDLFRKVNNTGEFAGLEEPMQLRNVKKIADEAGIGLDGIKVKIDRNPELIGSGYCGYTSPDGKTITLYPDAFTNTESLVKTLGHERIHSYQVKTFGVPTNGEIGKLFEQGAWGSESNWYNYYLNGK